MLPLLYSVVLVVVVCSHSSLSSGSSSSSNSSSSYWDPSTHISSEETISLFEFWASAAQCQCVSSSQTRSRLSCHPWKRKHLYHVWRVMPRWDPLELHNVERCPANVIKRHRGCHARAVAICARLINLGLCITKALKPTGVCSQR